MLFYRTIAWLLPIVGFHTTHAQMLQSLPPYQPSRTEVLAAYREATRLDSLAKNCIFKSNIKANWQPDNKSFWYRNSLPGNGAEYWLVDAHTGVKTKIVDTSKLAATKDNGFISGGIKSRWERQHESDSLSP